MASAGVIRNQFGPKKPKPDPVGDMYNIYNRAVEQQAGDYDDIMSKFRNIYADASTGDRYGGFKPYQADQSVYNKSADTTSALANLQDLSTTGGLSAADQQNLRARGVSPIRAMYATAQRDMDRNRRLAGGYSPNYGAVTARFARDQSSLIADQMDKVNAGIAQMVQQGRLSAAPQYAGAAQSESELRHGIERENTAARNEAKRFNAQGLFEGGRSRAADMNAAARGMTDLYGTTPALSNLYGSQAMNTAQFTNQVKEQKNNRNAGIVRSMFGR